MLCICGMYNVISAFQRVVTFIFLLGRFTMKQLFFFSAFICLSLLLPLSSEAQETALKVGVTDVFAPMCIRNDQGKLVG